MSDINVGSVSVDVVPNTRKFATELKAKTKDLGVEVAATVDTTGIRERIRESTKTKPAPVKVTPAMDTFAAKLKSEASAIAKSATVDLPLTADGERLRREITDQTALIAKLAKVEIPVDLADAAALRNKMALELDILKEMARQANPTVDINADTTLAEAQIDAVARDRSARVNVDSSGVMSASRGVSGMVTSVLALGPALVPVTAAIVGIGAALAAPVAAAGGGLTVFGVIAGAAVKETNKQAKQLEELKKKVDAAKASLAATNTSTGTGSANSAAAARRSAAITMASAKRQAAASIASAQAAAAAAKTPAARAAAEQRIATAKASLAAKQQTSQARLAASQASRQASSDARRAAAQQKVTEATKAYQAALKAMTPEQQRFLKSKDDLKAAFQDLVKSAGPVIFGPLIKGMNLLSKILPNLKPLISGVAGGINTLLSSVGKAVNGPGFKSFMESFGKASGKAIVSFGRIFMNFGRGLFGLFRAFAPLSGAFMRGLGRLSKSFADFGKNAGKNKGLQAFVGYIKDVGPKVAQAFGSIVKAVGRLVVALAPIGGVALAGLKAFSDLIRTIPVDVITAVAGAVIGLMVAFKGLQVVSLLTNPITLVVAAIVAVAAGAIYAYQHFKPFRDVVQSVVGWFKDHLLPALKDAANVVMPALRSAFDSVKKALVENRGYFILLGNAIKAIGKFVIDYVIPAYAQVYKTVLPLLGKAIGGTIRYIGMMGRAWVGMAAIGFKAFSYLVQVVLNGFDNILTGASKAFGWMPGIGPKIKAARSAFDEFRDGTVKNLKTVGAHIKALQDLLNNIKPKTIKLDLVTQTHATNNNDKRLGVPRGATGAIVRRPTVALIGEAGPEAVVPLNKSAGNSPLPGGGTHEIRGTLSLDRRGVATIHGVARDAVAAGRKQREATALHSAMGSESFQ